MADLFDDAPLGNSGEWYSKPETQVFEQNDEADKVAKAAPLIQEVVTHLQEQITFLNTLDSIPVDADLDPNRHQKIMEINRGIRQGLQTEVEYITNILESHIR